MSDSANISLRFGGEKHKRILEALLARKQISEQKMNTLGSSLLESEKQYQAYLPETDVDKLRAEKRDEDGEPQLTTLKIPYSYAIMLSAHTYHTSVFLGRNPVMQYTGRHGESEMQIQAMEALIDYQMTVGGIIPAHYIWMHDGPKYGFGVLSHYWANETVQTSRIVEEERTVFGMAVPGKTKKVKQTVRIPGYEGNRAFNVSPYDYLPDPRVPIFKPNDGEFAGRKIKLTWNSLVKGKDEKRYQNVDELRNMSLAKSNSLTESETASFTEQPEEQTNFSTADIKSVDMQEGFEMVVELIPRDWHLGTSESPEKWVFTVVGDRVVIEARPYGALHDQFPYDVIPNEIDGYTFAGRSMGTILKPLNDAMDWLVNSHLFNVRAVLNNQFVYDPLRIVGKDLQRGAPGKMIRLKETAYGTDIRSAIMQMPVADVTQGHLRDMQLIGEMMQRAVGVSDNIMGMVNSGGRKSATEIRSSGSASMNRLKTTTEFWSAVAYTPFSQKLVANTQQYYDAERKFKIAGDLMQDMGEGMVTVTPDSIAGMYDFVPVDGTMPVDRFAQANLWKEILMGMSKDPMLAQGYDRGGIFAWMSQLAGLKNIKRFKIDVVPDAQLQDEASRGNVVGVGGERGGRANAGLARDLTRIPGSGAVSGVGITG